MPYHCPQVPCSEGIVYNQTIVYDIFTHLRCITFKLAINPNMASTASQVERGTGNEDVLQQLTSWYSNLPSVRMDIHGDFAGSELFLVEGDTLVRHALTSAATEGAAVDMEGKESSWAIISVETQLIMSLIARRWMADSPCSCHCGKLSGKSEEEGLSIPSCVFRL